jgi:hypothetical protein
MVRLEIGLELLLAGAGFQVAQRELRRVVERLAGGLSKRLVLVCDRRLVERCFHVEGPPAWSVRGRHRDDAAPSLAG